MSCSLHRPKVVVELRSATRDVHTLRLADKEGNSDACECWCLIGRAIETVIVGEFLMISMHLADTSRFLGGVHVLELKMLSIMSSSKCAYSCVNGISFTRVMAKTKVCMQVSWQKASVHGCMDADVYAAHHLFPQGRRIDVAVVARLVAMEPNIDLATKMGENSSSSVSGAK